MRAKLLLVIFAASVCALALTLGSGELPSPANARSAVLSEGVFIPIGDGPGPASHAPASVPGLINFQGRLTVPSTGNAVADGNYSLAFRLCATQSPGDCSTPLWTETQGAVPVSGGLFNTQLGSVTPFAGSEFDGSVRYLEVQVGADPAMTPRLLFTSVAYAFHALDADSANSADEALALNCTGCITGFEVSDGTLSGDDIQDGSINTPDLAANSIGSTEIQDGTVSGTDIASNTITAGNVQFNYAGSTTEGGIANDSAALGGAPNTAYLRSDIADQVDGGLTFSPFALLVYQNGDEGIRISSNGVDGNQHIYFFEDGAQFNESLFWNDGGDRFEFSDDLHVVGDFTVTGTNVATDVNCTDCIAGFEVANGTLSGSDIQDGSITALDVQDGGLTGTDIADGTVIGSDIGNLAVGTTHLAANAVTADKVGFNYAGSTSEGGPATDVACAAAAGCVSGTEIVDGQVGSADIADNTIAAADVQFNYAGSTTEGGIANNSQLLDNIDSSSFLRSDASDTHTVGSLTIASTELVVEDTTILRYDNADTGLRLNANGGEGDQNICFFEGTACGEFLQWEEADGTDANDRFRLSDALQLDDLGSAGATTLCRNATGVIATCSSSARYKEDITALAFDGEKLLALRPVQFTWKDSGEPGVGLVAEEVADVIPELVTYNDKGEVEGVNYDGLTVYLLDLLKQHEKEISELRAASGSGSGSPAAASEGLGASELALVLAVAVTAAAVISAGTTLVVVRVAHRRAA